MTDLPDTDPDPDDGPDDEVMPPEDIRPPRAQHPGQYRTGKRNYGCLLQVIFFLSMVGLGIYLAAVTRGQHGPHKDTIGSGGSGAGAWRVEAYTDEQEARCVFLVLKAQDQALTGGCISSGGDPSGADVHEAELPGTSQWVVFGQTPASVSRVRLPLTQGPAVVVPAKATKGQTDRYYLYLPPPKVHTSGNAAFP